MSTAEAWAMGCSAPRRDARGDGILFRGEGRNDNLHDLVSYERFLKSTFMPVRGDVCPTTH